MNLPIEFSTFAYHGVELPPPNASGQSITTCPFCGKENHFFVSGKPKNAGQWKCHKCDASGNRYGFLQQFYEARLTETVDAHYRSLGKLRQTKHWQAFRDRQWAYDSDAKRWLIPVYNLEGSIVNLKVYLGPECKDNWQNTAGCSLHFYGLEQFDSEGPIFVMEGEPDKDMIQYIFPMVDDRHGSFLGVPGKGNFASCAKKLPRSTFANRDIVLLFDSGASASKRQQEAASLLSREYHARSVLCIHWPESSPDNYDVTNLIDSKGQEDAWAKILSWLKPHGVKSVSLSPDKKLTLNGVIKEFQDTKVHVNRGFADALTTVLATTASVRYGGIPIWLYLVDPPGYGKSLILESIIKTPICHYQTDLKYTTLVSGFKTEPDPSLLARINNRVLVVKDYTTILDKNEVAQKELLGLLRDAYDGEVVREFGNGVIRIYPDPASGQDRCYFGMICGVTPKIHVYNKAALGERFLKCSIGKPPVSSTEIARRAIEGANDPSKEVENANRRQEAIARFFESIEHEFDSRPPSVSKYVDRLIALADFAAVARTRPERDRATGDLLYDACAESSSRLSKQLTKVSQSLALVRGLKTIDEECLRLLSKTVWITSYGWHRNVIKALWMLRSKTPTIQEIARSLNLSVSTVKRVLDDLRDLHFAEKSGKRMVKTAGGRPSDEWKLTDHGHQLIVRSKLFLK